ncbi:MAG: ABC transporter permease, partial [Geminicoccaceae bacterium]
MPRVRLSGPVAALLLALLVHVVGMLLIKGFGTTFGIRAMLVLASLLAIASIGQTLAILLGGI